MMAMVMAPRHNKQKHLFFLYNELRVHTVTERHVPI